MVGGVVQDTQPGRGPDKSHPSGTKCCNFQCNLHWRPIWPEMTVSSDQRHSWLFHWFSKTIIPTAALTLTTVIPPVVYGGRQLNCPKVYMLWNLIWNQFKALGKREKQFVKWVPQLLRTAFKSFQDLKILYVWVFVYKECLSACKYMLRVHAWQQWRPAEGLGFPGIGAIDSCELPHECC